MDGFTTQIDAVNALADAAPGAVWRLQSEDGGGSSYVDAFDDPRLLVNLSVWESVDALRDFVLADGHMAVMRRRGDWFEPGTTESIVWDVPAGHEPTVEEAVRELDAFRTGSGAARDMRALLRR